MQGPHVGLKAIIQSFRIWILWSLAVIDRNDWHVERVWPLSCIGLMDKGAHADEATSVDVKNYSLWWRILFFEDLFYALQIVLKIFVEDVELFLEEVWLFILHFFEFSQIKLKRVVDSDWESFRMRFLQIKLFIVLLPIVDLKVRQVCILSLYFGKEVLSHCPGYVKLFRECDRRKWKLNESLELFFLRQVPYFLCQFLRRLGYHHFCLMIGGLCWDCAL